MKANKSLRLSLLSVCLLLLAMLVSWPGVAAGQATSAVERARRTYENPLHVQIPSDGLVESCADPSIIRGQQPGDSYWYVYCTTDALNAAEQNGSGGFNDHLIPMLRSLD